MKETTCIYKPEDLDQIKSKYNKSMSGYDYEALVCSGAGCISSDCGKVMDALLENLEANNLTNKIAVKQTGCMGTCDIGPVMIVMPEGVFYTKLDSEDIPEIVKNHFLEGNILEEKTYYDKINKKHVTHIKDIDYFNKQIKLTLKNCGSIDYSSLEEYISRKGFYGAAKALSEMSPTDVVNELKNTGLRGRGGGGFPTGVKWEAGLRAEGKEKYLVCNADEGDPGAFMDRSLLEGDPYGVIEGMIIGGYAIGANKGYVYVRAEYPIAVERLQDAIKKSREANILGKNIFGSGFDFDLEIRIGAGAFVCGEETALMESIEGERGEPRQKPPFPFQRGLFDKPTIINNVETFANVPQILREGSNWYKRYGREGNTGTKVFALAGAINNTGIIEVPMGTPLGDIIFDIGGGIPRNKTFKAAQTGGPSGGCITSKNLNTPVDYDSLKKLGAIMGSGGLISMDEDTCMVDMARFFMEFVQEESCGKCVPCRVGTKRMLEILERITKGEGEEGDIELLIELGETIQETAVCGLGQTAPNPVLSMIENFREEYEEHIKYKYCRAGVCGDLFISPCENACPAGVNVPGYISLIAEGRFRDAYNLVRKDNPFPAICGRVCTHPCESKCRRAQLDEPLSIADLKRFVSDYVMKHEEPYMDLVFPKKEKRIGIIGAGPSGLTCGYYLARLGYDVDVFESQPIEGGVLAFGIPEYRLPNDILEHEVNLIKQVGVKVHLNTEVGKDIEFEDIKEKFDAVYIATGTQFSNRIGISGEELKNVYHGLDFLKDVNLEKNVNVGRKVIVIGGGNTAIDAARTSVRLGAEKVTILYRRTREDMPADEREIKEAEEEGIEIMELVSPKSFMGTEKVDSIICQKMKLSKFDVSGRRKPEIIEGSEFVIKADMVIPAVSQSSDLPFIDKDEVEITRWGTFVTDRDTFMTKLDGVFAGGDVARGSDTAITAIADGKDAAEAIDKYLGGSGELNTGEDIEIPKPTDEKEIVEHERFPMNFLDPQKRINNFDEVAVGFHKLNAIAEAMRCLRCDRRI
ncbi:MAG: NADH-quinone oxidoreductase subunit NuoF [Bacillota bacterium]|nr:NADH-quinone oxidoreductase subunit NuoF [Bacillota bacterium]